MLREWYRQHMHEHNNHRPHSGHGDHAGHDHSQMVADFRKRFWISLLLTIPVLALSPMIQHVLGLGEGWRFAGDAYILTALSSVIYFYGGWPFLDGLRQEVRARNPGMMTLIGVAITAAYIYSVATVVGLAGDDFFWELVTLIDIMLFGHWIEMKSVIGAGAALEKLAALMPDTAHLLNSDGSTQEVAVNTLKGGEHLLVKPGEKIPADAIIIKGQTSANEAMLTGESKPVAKQEGDTVIGGAINGEGAIVIEVKHTGADSFLSGVIKLVQEAQASKSRTQDIANRAAFWLTVVALSVSGITVFSWLFFSEPTSGVRHRAGGYGAGHFLPTRARLGGAACRRRVHVDCCCQRSVDTRPHCLRGGPPDAGHRLRQNRHAHQRRIRDHGRSGARQSHE